MKNWLIAILGVSLAAISYTAYELELKSRPGPPGEQVAKVMTADGTVIPQNNDSQSTERAGQPIAKSPTDAAPTEGANTTADAPSDNSDPVAQAPVAGAAPATKTPDSTMGEGEITAIETGKEADKSAEMKMAARAPEPEASILDKAKGLVTNLFGDDKDETVASAPKPAPESAPDPATGPATRSETIANAKPSASAEPGTAPSVETSADASDPDTPSSNGPKGLMERAVGAVSNLFGDEKTAPASDVAKDAASNVAKDTPQNTQNEAGQEIQTAARLPDTAATPGQETPAVAAAPDAPETALPATTVPSFDVVRVERDGSAVIAGRAEPGAMVHLQAKGKSLGSAKASRRGEFVIIPDAPIPAGSSALSLKSELPDGKIVGSSQVVTVAVAGANSEAETKVAVATSAPATPAEASTAETSTAAANPAAPATPAEASTAETSTAAANPAVANSNTASSSAQTPNAPVAPVVTSEPAAPVEQKVAAAPQATSNETISAEAQNSTPNPVANTKAVASAKPKIDAPKSETPKSGASSSASAAQMPKSEMASNTSTAAGTTADTATSGPAKAPAVAATAQKGDGLADTQTAVIVGSQTGGTEQSAAPAAGKPAPEQQIAAVDTSTPNPSNQAVSGAAAIPSADTAPNNSADQAGSATTANQPTQPAKAQVPNIQVAAKPTPAAATSQTAQMAQGAQETAMVQTGQQTTSSVAVPKAEASAQGEVITPAQSVAPEQMVAPEQKSASEQKVAAVAPATKTSPSTSETGNSDTAARQTSPVSPEVAAPAEPPSPLVVISEPGRPSRVLQGAKPKPKTPVTFETVDYDDEGQIIIAGQVAPGADVRAYLGEAHLGDAKASADGQWVLRTTRDIDPGVYQLRVDKIDVGGAVLARVTAPFERASPDAVARVRANGEVIIQPGDNLWNISRDIYGTGTQYTTIYDANRNQISDADLIFPGQVFMTPGAPDASAAKDAMQAQSTSG